MSKSKLRQIVKEVIRESYDNDDTISYVLDGNHRIQKALTNDLPNIKVKLIKIKDLPIDFQEVLG